MKLTQVHKNAVIIRKIGKLDKVYVKDGMLDFCTCTFKI